MRLASSDADLDAGAIAHVNAHGTSTPLNDAAEATAIARVLGRDRRGDVDEGRHRAT